MRRKLLYLGLILPLTLCFTACGRLPNDDMHATPPQYEQPKDESYEIPAEYRQSPYWQSFDDIKSSPPHISIEDDFTEAEVLLSLTPKASFENLFHDYTLEDFSEVNAISVEEIDGRSSDSDGIVHTLRQCFLEDPSGATIPDHLTNFRYRMFIITLAEKSKENVIHAVEILYQMDGVFTAGANYIHSFDD